MAHPILGKHSRKIMEYVAECFILVFKITKQQTHSAFPLKNNMSQINDQQLYASPTEDAIQDEWPNALISLC